MEWMTIATIVCVKYLKLMSQFQLLAKSEKGVHEKTMILSYGNNGLNETKKIHS